MTSNDTPSALADARANDLARLREQYAFEGSALSAFNLAKGLWQNGLYDEAYDQFVRTRDMAPRAPDASLALIRAAIALGRLEAAQTALDHARAVDPELSVLSLHQAQLLTSAQPEAARDTLASHRSDAVVALFHDALDAVANGQSALARDLADPNAQAVWAGLVWLTSQQPAPRVLGTSAELLRHALETASLDGLVIECGVMFGRTLGMLAQWAGQRCHGFDSFRGKPPVEGVPAIDDPASTAGVIPTINGDVQLHPGWFSETLPAFLTAQDTPIRFLHIDVADGPAAQEILDAVKPWLRPGSVIVFGNFIGHVGSESQEFGAFQTFARGNGIQWQTLAGVLLGREVALRVTAVG